MPFAENLANAILVGQGSETPMSEVRRVLAPRGVVLAPSGETNALATAGLEPEAHAAGENTWAMGVKPWPAEMDEWTHPRHGPGGNAVSADLPAGRVAQRRHPGRAAGGTQYAVDGRTGVVAGRCHRAGLA